MLPECRPWLVRRALPLLVVSGVVAGGTPALAESSSPYCVGNYAEDLSKLAPRARASEPQQYSFCVRSTAVYECLSYAGDGSIRRTRRTGVQHGTAFAYKSDGGSTLLLTNEHVAEWPAVTPDARTVEGVPPGCKRVSENLKLVDNENDDYAADDVGLARVISDAQLDATILRAKGKLPVMPWKIGRSAGLHVRDAVEVRGFPLGAFAATNVGKVVSAFQHDDEGLWDHDDFVIDALLSNGNSGSPVLAVSCATGALELVGVFHAGYLQGSALNVVVGIDQLRDLMTTLKRTPHSRGEPTVAIDDQARRNFGKQLAGAGVPFFPFGGLAASVRSRSDGALVFELFARDFPFHTTPVFAFEDLLKPGAFGDLGRLWFGGSLGMKHYLRTDLDAEEQAAVLHAVEALRRDALSFFGSRLGPHKGPSSRQEFERAARIERTLQRTAASHRELTSAVIDVAERLAPHPPEAGLAETELFASPPPANLATIGPPAATAGKP